MHQIDLNTDLKTGLTTETAQRHSVAGASVIKEKALSNWLKMLFIPLLALVIGVLAGLGSILFRGVVALVHNILFSGQFNVIYSETVHTTPSIWGGGIIMVPALTGLAVIWLIDRFAQNERGLSVPEIMHKVRSKDARIEPAIALAKTLASTLSIGSGASIGREGPVNQLGATIGSLLCDIGNLPPEKRNILIAAGVAASTGAIFNAPLAGIAFAGELFLLSINLFSILIMAIAAFAGTFINNLVMGNDPVFTLQMSGHGDYYSITSLLYFLLFGTLIGIVSTLFIHGIYWMEDTANKLVKSHYLRHLLAMLMVGGIFYGLMLCYGHYYVEGIGFATIQDCLNLAITNPYLLLLLFLTKYLATCLSLGSGASGGIFSPALFLGATLGTLFAILINYIFPGTGMNFAVFALAGMGAMISSTTGAIITGILLAFEFTREIHLLLPVMITVFIAYLVRKYLCHESIYTLKLVRRGIKFPASS